MITRAAVFEGQLKEGMETAMRAHVEAHLLPLWRQFARAREVCVLYGVERDPGGPEIPLVLAITYDDADAMAEGLASPARHRSRAMLPEFHARFFEEVRLLHYVMEVHTE